MSEGKQCDRLDALRVDSLCLAVHTSCNGVQIGQSSDTERRVQSRSVG